jgi:ribosome biogenesis GTPase
MVEEEDLQDQLFPQKRRETRYDRKLASRTDRSKYKKTDQAQKEKAEESSSKPSFDHMLRGRVLSITGLEATVDCDGENFQCVLRGIFKKDRSRLKNLLTVGDFVRFEETSKGEGCIVHIEERFSILSRADNISRRKQQTLAANIDQVLITASVVTPPLKPFLIDRYIIAARQGNMSPIVIVNKMDLLEDQNFDPVLRDVDRVLCEEVKAAYEAVGIPLIFLSAEEEQGLNELKDLLKNKASVFAGQSGVGKSSLINAVTAYDLRVGDVVKKTRKGAHTTTRTNLLSLECGGWCIDTPGVSSFGVWDLKKEDVQDFYEEIRLCAKGCKFSDCAHFHEPGCAVLDAVEKGEISELRFESYQALILSIIEKHKPR